MSDIEVLLADIGVITILQFAKKHKHYGLNENRNIAKGEGEVASNTRTDIKDKLGENVISKDNNLNYQYIDDNKKLESTVS